MLIRKGLDTEKRSSPYSDSRQCDFVWWIGIIQDGCSLPGASPPTVILIAGHGCKCSALRFILSERTGDLIPRYRTGAGFGQAHGWIRIPGRDALRPETLVPARGARAHARAVGIEKRRCRLLFSPS